MSKATHQKPAPKPLEQRRGELRAVDAGGEFTGYIAVWDTVDSYNSSFRRGAFRKTIAERGGKVKVLYNHAHLIGRALELAEDDHGVRVRGRVNLETQRGRDVHALMQAGDLDGLSFAFQPIQETFNRDGVREIIEVRLYEFGPVDFPANEAAEITGVRADELLIACTDVGRAADEDRSTDFTETLDDADLMRRGYGLLMALDETLGDIWWSDGYADNTARVGALDAALADFHAAYLEWAQAFMARFYGVDGADTGLRSRPGANALAQAWGAFQGAESTADLAARTSLTSDEISRLRRGRPIEARGKLTELPEAIRAAHAQIRGAAAEALCRELRDGGFSPAEKRRIQALLGPAEAAPRQSEPAAEQAVTWLADFRRRLSN